jgi:all-trans-8'-apo-beta-carotenal 15,15'-oxygenase
MPDVPPIAESPIPYPPPIPTKWGGLFNSLRHEIPRDPHRRETGEPIREIEGAVPEDLNGDFMASGPVLFTVLGEPVRSWFDGQGGIHRIRMNGSKVSTWSRIVRSADYRNDEEKGVMETNHFNMNAHTVLPFQGARTFNTANTQPMMWQDRIFAMYEGGLPVELSDRPLDSLHDTTFDGLLHASEHLSAHYHYNRRRDTILNYGLLPHLHIKPCKKQIDDTQLKLYSFPRQGAPTCLAKVDLPAYPWLHDFIVSDRYAIFLVPPVGVDLSRMMDDLGTLADNYVWDNSGHTRLIVIDLNDPGKAIANVLLEPGPGNDQGRFWLWHFANAYEKDGELFVDFILYDDYEAGVKDFVMSIHRKRYPATVQPSRLVRASMRLTGDSEVIDPKSFEIQTLADISSEFCRVSPRALNAEYQYVWMAAHSSVHASYNCLWDTLCKVDVKNRTAQRFTLGEEQIPSEPIFVPSRGASAEDDGYVLTLVYDGTRDRSYLAIIAGAALPSDGGSADAPSDPVPLPPDALLARVWMPTTIPITFHRIFTGIGGVWPVENTGR